MPPRDNSAHLQRWREERNAAAVDRVRKALDAAASDGGTVSVAQIARAAGVSRSWLYTTDFIGDIRQLQATPQPRPVRTERASAESLRARLNDALEENQRLRAMNEDLRRQLEMALGQARLRSV